MTCPNDLERPRRQEFASKGSGIQFLDAFCKPQFGVITAYLTLLSETVAACQPA